MCFWFLPLYFRGIYPREISAYLHKKTSTKLFNAALFLNPKQETPQMPTTNKLQCIHTMEYLHSNKKEKTTDTDIVI